MNKNLAPSGRAAVGNVGRAREPRPSLSVFSSRSASVFLFRAGARFRRMAPLV